MSHACTQAVGNGLQQRVANGMAQRVVDLLEAIEIETQHRHDAPVAARVRQSVGEALCKQGPVRQFGEHVVQGQMMRLFARVGEIFSHTLRGHDGGGRDPGKQD
jgi:hypothetical protein